MASPAAPAAASQDTPITIKANVDGTPHKFKLPLRCLGATALEDKIRSGLDIAVDTPIKIERFSDSAANYVTLDATNASVFKQLYRAAKAKQKLKLRITTAKPSECPPWATGPIPEPADQRPVEKSGPRPASVEDEVEPEAEAKAQTPPLVDVSTPATVVKTESPSPQVSSSSTPVLARPAANVEALMKAKVDLSKNIMENLQQINDRIERAGEFANAARAQASPMPADHLSLPYRPTYAVCCNNCNGNIVDYHYHCSSCDEGDFDLCLTCVNAGALCRGADHWMIRRVVKNGVIINSTTERLPPKSKAKAEEPKPKPEELKSRPEWPWRASATTPATPAGLVGDYFANSNVRTCNSCVQDMGDEDFLHCETCEDFDLCKGCFAKNQHGHHPKHAFAPAVPGTFFGPEVTRQLGPGRALIHSAICDGCEKSIRGVRHKCLDCPDWDYCANCVVNAAFVHAGHRFVPIYESLEPPNCIRTRTFGRPVHLGICCDGPLCGANKAPSYIIGDRFKCAVCNDTDFCANCEASPANEHNRTHPLIKFKTPVRHVTVTTTGAHGDGQTMPAMGDRVRCPALRSRPSASIPHITVPCPARVATTAPVQTVTDWKPFGPSPAPAKAEEEPKPAVVETAPAKPLVADDLVAIYQSDTVTDGTVLAANHLFEQTWILRNEGQVPWPAGCSVRFVGGDYMGHVDSNHPAATSDIVSASESTVAQGPVLPGQEAQFSVLLRTPNRSGRVVSNWRLTTQDGLRFGHRLWCDVVVAKATAPPVVEESKETEEAADVKEEAKPAQDAAPEAAESQMIFPKLEKESPVSSIHEASPPKASEEAEQEEEYEDCAEVDEWAGSEEGFLTDEEYDILDASDEEFLEGQRKNALKK